MVNRGIKDLVEAEAGRETWLTICAKVGLGSPEFNDTTTYDDDITYALVAAASEVLDTPADQILEGFGRHWILFTGREGWGPLFDAAGDDLRSFIGGLDALHARVQSSMPSCRMPSFSMTELPGGAIEVVYRSERSGLAAMVVGLLSGLCEYFDESWQVSRREGADTGNETFLLEPIPAESRTTVVVG